MGRMLYMLLLCGVFVTCPASKSGERNSPRSGFANAPSLSQFQFPNSPCPRYFRYDYNYSNPIGRLSIPIDRTWTNFQLEVNMTVNAAVNNNDGLVIGVLSSAADIVAGRNLEYSINFPHVREIPYLTHVRFNGYDVCSGQPPPLITNVVQSSMWAKSTISTQVNGDNFGGNGGGNWGNGNLGVGNFGNGNHGGGNFGNGIFGSGRFVGSGFWHDGLGAGGLGTGGLGGGGFGHGGGHLGGHGGGHLGGHVGGHVGGHIGIGIGIHGREASDEPEDEAQI